MYPETLDSVNLLAGILNLQGKVNQSTDLLIKNLAARKEVDPKSPEIVVALNNLAQVYVDAGKHAKALPLFEGLLALLPSSMVRMI